MGTFLADEAARIATDTERVRYCVRSKDGSGFLFVNNCQDHVEMVGHDDVAFTVVTSLGTVRIPERGGLTVTAETSFILPFNQLLGDARLVYATAQPLTLVKYGEVTHYFYFVPDGLEPEYCFDLMGVSQITGDVTQETVGEHCLVKPTIGAGAGFDVTTRQGETIRLTTLTRSEAEQTWKGTAWGAERVVVGAVGLIFVEGRVEILDSHETVELRTWPPLTKPVATLKAAVAQKDEGNSTVLQVSQPSVVVSLDVKQVGDRKYMLRLPQGIPDGLSEVFLTVDYEGDTGMAFNNGCLVADNFNNGTPWVMGLKHFVAALTGDGLCFVFSPLRQGIVRNVSSQLAGRFEFEGQEKLVIHSMTVRPEYRVCLE
jgi:hypothetical protein